LYDDKFELASAKNKYDLGMLIKFLKFCTESTDEEFAKNLSKYLDINSLVGLMVIDDLV
jgi:spore coat protein CotH